MHFIKLLLAVPLTAGVVHAATTTTASSTTASSTSTSTSTPTTTTAYTDAYNAYKSAVLSIETQLAKAEASAATQTNTPVLEAYYSSLEASASSAEGLLLSSFYSVWGSTATGSGITATSAVSGADATGTASAEGSSATSVHTDSWASGADGKGVPVALALGAGIIAAAW